LYTKKWRAKIVKISNPEFFYTNYVGSSPEDDKSYYQTADMIEHYVDAGMTGWLPKIYEYGAKRKKLDAHNIPCHLWKEGNLLEENRFYLHPALTLFNPPPQFNPETGTQVVYPYYRENIEFFSLDMAVLYVEQSLPRINEIKDIKQDFGSIRYLLNRYAPLKAKGINPLDMFLFLVSDHKGERIGILELQKYEDEIVEKILAYIEKLKQADKYKICWRGHLNE
jgi:hypothetical protein